MRGPISPASLQGATAPRSLQQSQRDLAGSALTPDWGTAPPIGAAIRGRHEMSNGRLWRRAQRDAGRALEVRARSRELRELVIESSRVTLAPPHLSQ
jgi:hypothetical protein